MRALRAHCLAKAATVSAVLCLLVIIIIALFVVKRDGVWILINAALQP